MSKKLFVILSVFCFFVIGNTIQAQCNSHKKSKAVKANYQELKDVVDIAIGSPDHTTLVAAVKAADLVSTLKSDGPFTVFAPTNTAFGKLPDGTVASLLEPANKAMLTKILTYHVIAGEFDSGEVIDAIKKNNDLATFTTVSGNKLKAYTHDGNVYLVDEKGNRAKITAVDLKGENGIVHVIDTVVLPK